MQTLVNRYKRLLDATSVKHVRSLNDEINWDLRLIGIRGARGVGKTTLMLQHLKTALKGNLRETLYASLDHAYFSQHTLTELAENFYRNGGKHLYLDEVHKYERWSQEVKNIYDEYPGMHIVFSGSSSLKILNAQADLSRRCISYSLQGLSFREYLQFYHGINIKRYTLGEILADAMPLCDEVLAKCRPLPLFKDYLCNGYYPFYLESSGEYYTRIENVVDFILQVELPQQFGVEVGNCRKMKSLLAILSTNVPMAVDITKLSKTSEIARTTLLSYLKYLADAKLLHLLYSDLDSIKRMQKPDKIYPENTNMMYALTLGEPNEGTLREVFFVNQLAQGHEIEYAKTSADYFIDRKYTIEIGGKSKDGGQIANVENSFIASDDIELPYGNKIPLWAFGFLY